MPRFVRAVLRHVGLFLGYGVLGGAIALMGAYIVHAVRSTALMPWHTVHLEGEFHAGSRITSFEEYLANEEQLFAEVRQRVHSPAKGPADALTRYASGSASDPATYRVDWNRSFELVPSRVRGGVLLLHGLSDSPYSMRALALRLRDEGYRVIGLRLPGHGTIPTGLVDARAEDWSAAVRLAMRYLRGHVPPTQPLYIAGYSTGATLAIDYVTSRGAAADLPAVEGLVLISPAMGVSPAAALAGTQTVLSRVPGLAALAWTSVAPEYDPFRYNSFAMNAGKQIYLLTRRVTQRLAALDPGSGIAGLPPILAFQSVADATVEVNALVDNLYAHLSRDTAHRMVLFDFNRRADLASLLKPKEDALVKRLLTQPYLPFALTLVTNERPDTSALVALGREAGALKRIRGEPLAIAWPAGIYSLSHVALPFSRDDPHYGAEPPAQAEGIYLGHHVVGELGFLKIPESSLARLRYNPFFDWMAAAVVRFLEEGGRHPDAGDPRTGAHPGAVPARPRAVRARTMKG